MIVGVFRRRRAELARYERAEVSLLEQMLGLLTLEERGGAGVPIDVEELPAAIGITELHADVTSSFPMYGVRPDGAPLPAASQPMLLAQPDPSEDRSDTIGKIVRSLMWKGNAYGLIAGDRRSVRILDPNTVGFLPRIDDPLAVAYWLVDGRTVALDRLAHWKIGDDPRRGPLGRSPIRQAERPLRAYTWAYRYMADFFEGGGLPSSIIHSKIQMDPDKMREHVTEWIAARQARRPAMMPPHLSFEVPNSNGELPLVANVVDMAAAEIGRLLNMPPSITNAAVSGYSLSYSNVADDLRRWMALALGPKWLAAVRRGFNQVLPPGQSARFDITAGEFAELVQAAAAPAPTPQQAHELTP